MQPSPQNIQLLSKHRVLSLKPQLRLEWRGQDGQNETEQPDHSASLSDSITINSDKVFGTHKHAFACDFELRSAIMQNAAGDCALADTIRRRVERLRRCRAASRWD